MTDPTRPPDITDMVAAVRARLDEGLAIADPHHRLRGRPVVFRTPGGPALEINFFLESCKVRKLPAEVFTVYLNFHSHLIKMIYSVNIYHKLIANLGYFEKYVFNLRREDVDSTYHEHIIASAQ